MSRYTFTGNRSHLRIVVGWDRPLQTYFAQVWDGGQLETGNLVLWVGAEFEQVPTVDALAEQLAPFGSVPVEIVVQLRDERTERCEQLTPLEWLMSGR